MERPHARSFAPESEEISGNCAGSDRLVPFSDYCLVAYVDERQVTPTNIMEQFASQLHMTGTCEKAQLHYKEALRRLQSGRETLRETVLGTASEVAAGPACTSSLVRRGEAKLL